MFEWLGKTDGTDGTDGKPTRGLLFMPSLISLVATAEREKGSPLTETEVLTIRDRAAGLFMPADAVRQVEARRGYSDLDPDHCWLQWQEVRSQFATLDSRVESMAANEHLRQERIKMMPEVASSPRHTAGPPCPRCGKPLRTAKVRQCFLCGAKFDSPPAAATKPAAAVDRPRRW